MKTSVVIIGGGVAGLATGALLAKKGRAIVLLEKGNVLGGRAYSYEKDGFILNYGAHGTYGFRTGFLPRVLKALGEPLIPHGIPSPRKSYFAFHGRFGRLGAMPHHVLTAAFLQPSSRLRLLRVMLSLRLANPDRWLDATWRQWLEAQTRDADLIRFLEAFATINTYTRPAADLSAGIVLAHFKRHLFAGDYVGYMSRGWGSMYNLFADVIRRDGGIIKTGEAVERLEVEGGRVVAAVTSSDRYEASAFVCTLPPQDAPALAEGAPALRDELGRWAGLVEARAVGLDIGFRAPHRADLSFVFDVERDLYYSIHSVATPDLAPQDGALLHTLAYLSPEEAADESLTEKRRAELVEVLDRHFPRRRELTAIERPLPNVIVSSARWTPDQMGKARVPLHSGAVDNLYFAGDARDLPYILSEIGLASALEVAGAIEATRPVQTEAVAAG